LKYNIYNETKDVFVKSLELLYQGESDVCKEAIRDYLVNEVVPRTVDTDNALKKFFRSVLLKYQEVNSVSFASSNLVDVLEMLDPEKKI
jgi:hypothetical protein